MKTSRTMMLAAALVLTVSPALFSSARAEIKTKEVEYTQNGTPLQGFIAWDDARQGKRPGLLVVHEWWGHNEHARTQARRLAEAGYVGFALDLYGKGKVATHPKDAEAFMNEALKDPAALAARFKAALDQLKQDPHVDPEKIGAIGYCFGGAVALNMARSGMDLDAVATFHGLLATETPAQPGQIKGRILVATGADDPMVPASQVQAFEQEMKKAGVRYEVNRYPGAKHAFTNPKADSVGMDALAYNAEADRKSWEALLKMLKEVWG
jgi:dienelactone hydrolase